MIITIKKDKNNETRFRLPNLFTGNFKKTWRVALAPNCWYPKELGYNQINKLVGVTEFWSANDVNSIMIGWEPCYLPEEEILEKYPHCKNLGGLLTDVKYFNVYYYINDERGGHTAEFLTVIADWRVSDLDVTMEKDSKVTLKTSVTALQFSGKEQVRSNVYPVIWGITDTNYTVSRFPYNWAREIYVWFGGRQKAPQDMQFKVG